MNEKFYIYEIKGKKIGCTTSIKTRKLNQKGEYIILEEHTNIYMASRRERILQAEYGYPIDKVPYYKIFKNNKKAHTPEIRAKAVTNTDYKARTSKIDYKAKVANTNYTLVSEKRSANTNYKSKARKCYKAVKAKLEDGTLYGEWESRKKASQVTGIAEANIGYCLNGSRAFGGKSPEGKKLIWSYKIKLKC
jgi:hypothetical protein